VLAGAYWTRPSFLDGGPGNAVAATLTQNPSIAERYFAPAARHVESGGGADRLRTAVHGNVERSVRSYALQVGVRGENRTRHENLLLNGDREQLRLGVDAGTVSVWTKTGTEFTLLLSVAETTYTSGFAGLEGAGNITRLTPFRAGQLAPF
jgi:hypothetical protein